MQTPAKELPANAVIDAEIGALLAAVAQPAAQDAGEARSGGKVEVDDGVRALQAFGQDASFMPSMIQVGLAMSLRCRAGPRLGGGLDAAAVAELPVVGVDVDDGDAQAS